MFNITVILSLLILSSCQTLPKDTLPKDTLQTDAKQPKTDFAKVLAEKATSTTIVVSCDELTMDFDNNTIVDWQDFLAFAGQWLWTCENSLPDNNSVPKGCPQPSFDYKIPISSNIAYVDHINGPQNLTFNGTASNPIFITMSKPEIPFTNRLVLRGSYFIVDGLIFAGAGSFRIACPSNFVCVRNCDVSGNLNRSLGIEVSKYSNDTGAIKDIVLYNNKIHDLGDMLTELDQDATGISIGDFVSNSWILNNTIWNTSGSGLQICAGATNINTTHHIYVAGNEVYNCRQSGLAVKQAVDIIFIENYCHDIITTPWSVSKGLGFQYAPQRVWFVNNTVENCMYGIYGGSDTNAQQNESIYIVGNTLNSIGSSKPYSVYSGWSPAAIMLSGGTYRYIVDNKINDIDAGINGAGGGYYYILNNSISNIRPDRGHDIYLERGELITNFSPDQLVYDEYENRYGVSIK